MASGPQFGHLRAIFLTGFMGAGKTTVGRLLAEGLGWRFVDLDETIEADAGCSIAQVFDQQGESHFRKLEADALKNCLDRLAEAGPAVVALGGGALSQPNNLWLLAQVAAPTIFLDAPVDELLARCRATAIDRPLSRHENQFRQLFQLRRRVYMEADVRIDTHGRSPIQVADEIVRSLAARHSREL